jgi:hypothetical protein
MMTGTEAEVREISLLSFKTEEDHELKCRRASSGFHVGLLKRQGLPTPAV